MQVYVQYTVAAPSLWFGWAVMNSASTIILYEGNILSFSIETAYIGITLHAHDAKQHHSVNIYFTLTCKYILAVSICGLFQESRLVISAAVVFLVERH